MLFTVWDWMMLMRHVNSKAKAALRCENAQSRHRTTVNTHTHRPERAFFSERMRREVVLRDNQGQQSVSNVFQTHVAAHSRIEGAAHSMRGQRMRFAKARPKCGRRCSTTSTPRGNFDFRQVRLLCLCPACDRETLKTCDSWGVLDWGTPKI